MELYDTEIRDKYYAAKRKLKRLLNELQTADDVIQVSQIYRAIDDVICDLVRYKIGDINRYRDERIKRDRFYMKASSIDTNKEYIVWYTYAVNAERQEDDGKKA